MNRFFQNVYNSRSNAWSSAFQPSRGFEASGNSNEFNPEHYGADPTGKSDSGPAIVQAFQEAGKQSGSKVVFSSSHHSPVYMTSCITIDNVNNISVEFSGDAMVQAPSEPNDWKWNGEKNQGLITFTNMKNIVVSGSGSIDGNNKNWDPNSSSRPQMIVFENCSNWDWSGVNLTNGVFYHSRYFFCNEFKMHDFSIEASSSWPNNDGLNIDSGCSDFEIYNLKIANGDDSVAINSFSGPSSNFDVHDLIITSGHGCSIGSGTYQSISNVRFHNCQISNTAYIFRIKNKLPPSGYPSDPAPISNITFSSIQAENVSYPCEFTNTYDGPANTMVTFSDITIENITCSGSRHGPTLECSDSKLWLNPLKINNVQFNNEQTNDGSITNVPVNFIGKVVGFGRTDNTAMQNMSSPSNDHGSCSVAQMRKLRKAQKMFFANIIALVILLAALWLLWRYLIRDLFRRNA